MTTQCIVHTLRDTNYTLTLCHIKKLDETDCSDIDLIFSLNSCGQTKGTEIESILLDCLVKSYNEQEVNINQELDKLETYLIESKSLKSSKGQSYFDFYKETINLNDIPTTLDFDKFENIYKLTPNAFYSVDCL